MAQLAKVVRGVPAGRGGGVFWWAAEYQMLSGYNLAGFDLRSFFGADSNILPVTDAFGSMAAPVNLGPVLSNNTLVLSWPLSGAGMRLVTSSNLTSGLWSNVTNSLSSTGAVVSVSLPILPGPARFYRLQGN